MSFDYTTMSHNVKLLIEIFAKTPEQKRAAENALSFSKRYQQGFIEEALVEGFRKKGFIINDAATLKIVMEDYTRGVTNEYLEKYWENGALKTVSSTRGILLLVFKHLGIEPTLEVETEMQHLDTEDLFQLGS